MAIVSLMKKEAADVEKEEKWLLREIKFLEDFNEDVTEILELQKKIIDIQRDVESGKFSSLQKKLLALQEEVQKDERCFRKFKRILARGERRRVRYENRVLGRIALIERYLDQPTKKELDTLVEQVQVYSARVLTELSWRVGKIVELSSQKNPELSVIKKHLDATLEASKALVALLEKMEHFAKKTTSQLHALQSTHSFLPQTTGLRGYLRDSVIKTAFLRSIPKLHGVLEEMWSCPSYVFSDKREKYLRVLEEEKIELSKVLTAAEIEMLKDCPGLPEKGTFLFLPGFKRVILAFNIDKIPSFAQPGWLFHGLGGGALRKISASNLLISPMESIFKYKDYYSWKFWNSSLSLDAESKRIYDGISFGFQYCGKYLGYCLIPPGIQETGGDGGFWIFPIRTVLRKGLILDFANTLDHYPEICLRDPAYAEYRSREGLMVTQLLYLLRRNILPLIHRIKPAEELFLALQKNPSFIDKLYSASSTNESILFVTTSPSPGFYAQRKNSFRCIVKENYFLNLFEKNLSTSPFFKREELLLLNQYCKENNFAFFFCLLHYKIDGHPEIDFLPPFARYSRETSPGRLSGTILNYGLDYLADPAQITWPIIFTSTYMKHHSFPLWRAGYSLNDYVEQIKHLSSREFKKIFLKMVYEIVKSLEQLIKDNFRTKEPCTVDVSSGLLVLAPCFDYKGGSRIINRFIDKGIPLFINTSSSTKNDPHIFNEEELEFLLFKVLGLENLPIGRKFELKEKSYFYLKEGKLRIHLRESNKDFSLD